MTKITENLKTIANFNETLLKFWITVFSEQVHCLQRLIEKKIERN